MKAFREEAPDENLISRQKTPSRMISTEENKQKLERLIAASFNRLQGYHVRYNIVSCEKLPDARIHPEKH